MTGPRFRPSSIFLRSRDFGRLKDPEVDVGCSLSQSEAAWALFQHKAAYSVLQELGHLDESLSHLSSLLAVKESWLTRKLRGHTPADPGDVLSWALVLGVHVLPVIDDLAVLKI